MKKDYAWHQTSRHDRGYGTRWDKLRKQILKRDKNLCHCPVCKGGEAGGRLTPADTVDHILPKAQDPDRLRWFDPESERAIE